VDNDREFSSLLAGLLDRQEGINCARYFSSAEAVLDALRREAPPDVILLDIEMEGIGGLEAIRPIKALAGSTRVFMLTSFYDSQRRTRALRDGATDFLLKVDTVDRISSSILRTTGEKWSAGADSRVISSGWPKRRASEVNTGRLASDNVTTQQHPDEGRRSVPWRSVSSQLVRGVSQLREFLGLSAVKPAGK
jgi:DNA-binding NarL/FixJ family response regulator